MGILSKLGVPAFSAGGVPELAESDWRLRISGMVESEISLSMDDIRAMKDNSMDARLTSVSGFSVRAQWQGVLWRDFMATVGLLATANHATFTSQGGGYTTTSSLADLDHPRVMLVHGVEDEPLERDYGGPLRMVIPHLWGYKSAKWLAEIEFVHGMRGGYWEDRGYTRTGNIEAGKTLDINSGVRRPHRAGEITEF